MKLKKTLALMLALAMVLAVAPNQISNAAKKKSLTMSVELAAGTTLRLSAVGGKSYTWKSSKSSVASVSSKGVVTAKKKGTATITVKDKKSKASQSFIIKVTGKDLPISPELGGAGDYVYWKNFTIDTEKTKVTLDGKPIEAQFYNNDEGYSGFSFDQLSEGKHTFVITVPGYAPYTFKVDFTKKVYDTLFIEDKCGTWGDGTIFIWLNPDVVGDDSFVIKIDGVELKDKPFINGDGFGSLFPNPSDYAKGEHTVTAKSDSHPEETATFTIQ